MYNALVTGASSGIGKAIYEQLNSDPGWCALGISRRGPDLFYDLREQTPDPLSVRNLDLLINCAGIMPFEETKEVFDVNFWGTYCMIENFMPCYTTKACIINIASVAGMIADKDFPIYAASKAAVISLTKSLAKKYAPNIRVNCISPGFYKTNLVPGETPQELIKTIPMGYEEEARNIFTIVQMIWGTKYMTGANIVVDGGVSL